MIGALILGNTDQGVYYTVMAVIAFASIFIFLFIKKPIKASISVQDYDVQQDFKKDIKDTFNLMISKRMLHMFPLIIWSALSLCIFSGLFIVFFTEMQAPITQEEKRKALQYGLLCMMTMGVAEMIGGFIVTPVINVKGMRAGVFVCLGFTSIAFAVFIILNEVRTFGWYCFLFTFLWGIQDSCLNTVANSMLGFEFESNITPFSVYKFAQSLFVFVFDVLESLVVGKKKFRIYIIVMFVFSVFAYLVTSTFKFKPKPPKGDQYEEFRNKEDNNTTD